MENFNLGYWSCWKNYEQATQATDRVPEKQSETQVQSNLRTEEKSRYGSLVEDIHTSQHYLEHQAAGNQIVDSTAESVLQTTHANKSEKLWNHLESLI